MMIVPTVGLGQHVRPGVNELAHGETLRVIAATVGDTSDFRAERRALINRARALRLQAGGGPSPAF